MAERLKFYRCDQADTEPLADYIAALRKLTIDCEFNKTAQDGVPQTQLEQGLRDHLVCGL